jgi:predicted transposase/invertase (TIGR01784 family)
MWIEKYQSLLNDSSIPYAEIGFYYILAVDASADTLEKLQKNAEPKTKETIMNAAQRLIQQGMQQGMQARNLEIAKQMLSKGLDMQFICEMTGLSEAKINALQ